ncbi:hypothetical protein AOG25_09805 [Vibrio alginolyticus]|nr:hypothetical protein AOG25_09805 [Vibrio alginolyticus]
MSDRAIPPNPHDMRNFLTWHERQTPPITLKEGQIDAGNITVIAVDMNNRFPVTHTAIYTARRRHSKTNRVVGWNRDDFTHWAYYNLPGESHQRVDV